MPTLSNALKAILLISVGKLIFSTQDVIIKQFSDAYPLHQLMIARSAVALLCILIIVYFSEGLDALKGPKIPQQLVRGVLMFCAFTLFYLALADLPLTQVTVLFFTAPFFITLLSIPCLGESVGIHRWASILIGFCGVALIARPDLNGFGISTILPVLAAFFYAYAQILSRQLGEFVSAAVITFYANIVFLGLAIVLTIATLPFQDQISDHAAMQFLTRSWAMPDSVDTMLMIVTGITATIGFLFTTQSYRLSEASRLAPFEYIMLVWVTLLSYLVWQEVPDWSTIGGTILIVGAGLYVMHRESANAIALQTAGN